MAPRGSRKPVERGTPTADPEIVIEAQREGYVRYRRADGRRWEVHGTCDRRGDCLIGAAIPGFGTVARRGDIARARRALGGARIDSDLDVPVTPEFRSCCGADRFRYVELPRARA